MRLVYCLLFIAFVFFLIVFIINRVLYAFECSVKQDGIDENLYEYLCRVDICFRNFIDASRSDKFEIMWRKIPHNINWCSTNAQMSIAKYALRSELVLYKVKNMLTNGSRSNCTAIIIEFDGDKSISDVNLQKSLSDCKTENIPFRYADSGGLANRLRNINTTIDYLVVGPSKTSSYLLFQQFLSDYDNIMPTVCQVNFAYSLPKYTEENGFRESFQNLRTNSKYLLIGSSKDRTDMHLNLFFVNMKQKYCRDRYLRYFSYY